MTVYLATLGFVVYFFIITSLGTTGRSPKTGFQNGLSALVGLTLITILALRGHTVGVDVKVYLRAWALAETRDLYEITRYEPSFVAITEISRTLSDSPQFYLTVIAVLSIAPISYAIWKGSSRPLLSWIIFIGLGFYTFTFSGLRQSIAYGLTILAIHFIRKRQLVPFLTLVGIAWTFHASALIFLPAYWVYRHRLRRWGVAIYVACVPIIFLFRETIFQWFTSQFYSNYEISTSTAFVWFFLSGMIVILAWLQLRIATHRDGLIPNRDDVAGLLQIATVGVTLMLFASVGTNVMRMADYYYMAVIFALPAVLDTVTERFQFLIKTGFVFALVLIYIMQLTQSPYGIVPYILFTERG